MSKWILWDFDGTLAWREGFFSGALLKVLKKYTDMDTTIDDIRAYLKNGFPWHEPEKCYEDLCEYNKWWDNIEKLFVNAYVKLGIQIEEAIKLAKLAHYEYVDPEGFSLFPDTIEVLKHYKEKGWSNAILSNHTPDLPQIINSIGLGVFIDVCITSAFIGYEKPNSMFYKKSFDLLGKIDGAWMIGDNFVADIQGAEAVGLKTVHVRGKQEDDKHLYSPDLLGLKKIIL